MHLCTSSYSLRQVLPRLKNSVGHDGVHALLLKHSSDNLLTILAKFLNMLFYSLLYSR